MTTLSKLSIDVENARLWWGGKGRTNECALVSPSKNLARVVVSS